MFFFIGGVQPRTVDLEERPRMCQSCGLYQVRLKRVDHYISVFFIPVIRIKKGTPFLRCERCGSLSGVSEDGFPLYSGEQPTGSCRSCGKQVDENFRFCPFCGKSL